MAIINYDPATLLQIKVGDLSAPVIVGTEMSKLYLTNDEIVRRLLSTVTTDEETGELLIPPDLLPWMKEQRMILIEVHKVTGEIEKEVGMKKLDLQIKLFKEYFKDLTPTQKIKKIKELKDGKSLIDVIE